MKIAFITGSSRSGTSILGELIASHPNVNYVFEERVWRKLEGKDKSHKLGINEVSPEKRSKLRSWMACYKTGNKLIVEKNPRHILTLPLLKSIFPESKIIHIVRDGRDVACSLKSGLCGKTWAHVKPPRWKQIETKYEGIIRCAWAYRDIMDLAIKDLKIIPHYQVKYEDLLNSPQKVAEGVMKYLELDLNERVINFCKNIQDSVNGSYLAKHQTRWHTSDHTRRVGRWQDNMTKEEQKQVEIILRPVLDQFGYK